MMYVLSLLNIFIFNSILSTSASKFPADKFFNISSSEIVNFSHFLCHVQPKESKCCSCDNDCFQDCCIDYRWKQMKKDNLDVYLSEIQKRFFDNRERYTECASIINPLLDSHESESIIMTTSYYSEYRDRYFSCPLNRSVLNIPVFGFNWDGFYINKQCALNDGEKYLKYLNILVQCSRVPELLENTVFEFDQHYKNSQCRFKLERSSFISRNLYKPCKKYVDKCVISSTSNYALCQIYAAKTGAFKNPHCKRCISDPFNKDSSPLELPDKHRSCQSESIIERPTSFLLQYNDQDGTLRVKHLEQPFPFETFLESITNMKKIPMWYISCKYPKLRRGCSCSTSCFLYRTCCMDILWQSKHPIRISTYKKRLVEKSKNAKDANCQPLVPRLSYDKNDKMKYVAYLYMITMCPHNSSGNMKAKCINYSIQHYESFIPVIGEDGLVYRNRFCAACNSVEVIDVANITVGNCRNSEITKFTNSCSYDIHENNVTRYGVQKCSPFEIDSPGNCSIESSYFHLCNAYSGSVGYYRNHHCGLCNNHTVLRENYESLSTKFLSWSFMISFSVDFSVRRIESLDEYLCRQESYSSFCLKEELNNVLSPEFKRCIERRNLTLFIITNNNIDNYLSFLAHLNLDINASRTYQIDKEKTFHKIDGYVNHGRILQIFKKNKAYFTSQNISLVFTHMQRPFLSEFHQTSFPNTFLKGICHAVKQLNLTTSNFTKNCNILFEEKIYEYNDVSFGIFVEKGKIYNRVYACEQFYRKPNCDLKTLRGNLTIDKNGFLSHSIGGKMYKNFSPMEYIPLSNGAAVCLNTEISTLLNEIERYITIVGTPLSCMCYISILPILWTFTNFQNLSGRCSMALIANLLLADSSFFVAGALYGTSYATNLILCKTIAIITHFALTMTHSWSTIMSYDMMITFSNLQHIKEENMKKFSKYAALTFFYSFLIVGVSFCLDLNGIIKSGYGDNGICTFYLFYGRLYFYIIPTMLSFSLTLTFSLISMFKIKNTMKVTEQVLGVNLQNRKQLLKIAASLVLILGIGEGIGFVQVTNSNQYGETSSSTFNSIIKLIYSFVRSLRGVLLLLVYACKKDTQRILLQKVRRCLSSHRNVIQVHYYAEENIVVQE